MSRKYKLGRSVNDGLTKLKKVDDVYNRYTKIKNENELEAYQNAQFKYGDPFAEYFRNLPDELQ